MKFTRYSWLLVAAFAVGCQDAAPSAPQTQTTAQQKDTAEPKFDLSEPPVPASEPAGETKSADDSSASSTPK